MDDASQGDDFLDGNGSVADYIQQTGGAASPAIDNQNIFDVLDNGLLSSNAGSSTDPNGKTNGTIGASQSDQPGWLTGLQSLLGTATSVGTTVSPLINGKPSPSPAPVTGQVAMGASNKTLLLIVAAIVAFILLKPRRA